MASEPTEPVPDVDALVARLRARVDERRRAGFYPDNLEADLDAHFARVVAHRPDPYDYSELELRMRVLEEAMGITPSRISYDSGVPGGDVLHRAVAKVVSRQTAGVLEQLQQFANATRDVLREVVQILRHPNAHAHPEVLGQVDSLLERMASIERAPASTAAAAQLERRLAQVEAAMARDQLPASFEGADFEDQFRGGRDELLDRYDDLAKRFIGCDPVVDLGCGRGEFLELLGRHGVAAAGVDIEPRVVKSCRAMGLDVQQGEAVDFLASSIDGSLGGISMIQVIEHLSPGGRSEVVRLAAEKLRPGGKLVVETLNPQSLYIFARALYVDPTHTTPMHPAYLEFLVRQAGFTDIAIEWRSPPPEDEVLQPLVGEEEHGFAKEINTNLERLNELLFSAQDYAIIATR